KMRLPLSLAGAAGACALPAAASGFAAGFSSGASASVSDLGAEERLAPPISSTLSPSSTSTAIGVLTATPWVPSAIRILPITPSSTASNSIVALSVSISARMSPDFTVSPSDTSHLASVPSSIVGESAGIRISVAMSRAPLPIGHVADGLHDLVGRDQRQPFKVGRIGHRHVLAGAVDHRSVQPVKGVFRQIRADVVADRADGEAFFHGDAAVGLLH